MSGLSGLLKSLRIFGPPLQQRRCRARWLLLFGFWEISSARRACAESKPQCLLRMRARETCTSWR